MSKVTKHKVLTVIGTRPEAIKLAPVIQELKRQSNHFTSVVCTTAQHRQLLDQALTTFHINPDYDLDLMTTNQNLAHLTSQIIKKLNSIVSKEQPNIVLIQGDTTTAFSGALVAYYHQIKIGHVEAGLRTQNKYSPFPEEINRRLVSHLADYHFAPTKRAKNALLREGIPASSIFITGNPVIDTLLWVRQKVHTKPPAIPRELAKAINNRKTILVTGHRRESFGKGFENICHAILEIANSFPEAVFVYPVHLNPNVHKPVYRILGQHQRIHLIKPLPYEPFVWLMDQATIILTDSGGIQEEAPSLGKPVLVMRETTERPEGIEAGNAQLVGTQRQGIVNALAQLLLHPNKRKAIANIKNPYGDGQASQRIVNILACNK